MAAKFTRQQFVAFVQTLAGKQLTTRAQHRPFTVRVTGGGLEFLPGSTQRPRPESSATLDRVLEEFAANESLQPRQYQDLTRNASYVLSVIALYLEQHTPRR